MRDVDFAVGVVVVASAGGRVDSARQLQSSSAVSLAAASVRSWLGFGITGLLQRPVERPGDVALLEHSGTPQGRLPLLEGEHGRTCVIFWNDILDIPAQLGEMSEKICLLGFPPLSDSSFVMVVPSCVTVFLTYRRI